jgi:hypothetical protein
VRTCNGELAECRNRVTELEANQVNDGLSLKACGRYLARIHCVKLLIELQRSHSVTWGPRFPLRSKNLSMHWFKRRISMPNLPLRTNGIFGFWWPFHHTVSKSCSCVFSVADLGKELSEKDAQLRTARSFHAKWAAFCSFSDGGLSFMSPLPGTSHSKLN